MNLFSDFFPDEVLTLFSDRSVDFTLQENQTALTPQQSEYLSQQMGFPLKEVVTIRQVHGAAIIVGIKEMSGAMKTVPEADGVVTDQPLLALTVRTADCLPISIYDPKHHCIAMVHTGWRGSQQKIVLKAIAGMRKKWGRAAADLKIGFGPCIRRCCYQVGEDFQKIFSHETFVQGEGLVLDLPLINRNQLVGAGVLPENISDCGLCTCCDQKFFSYRREKEKAGRHISLILLKAV